MKTYLETLAAPFDITARQYSVLRILRGAKPEGLPTLKIAGRLTRAQARHHPNV